jgi:hypothetical protein
MHTDQNVAVTDQAPRTEAYEPPQVRDLGRLADATGYGGGGELGPRTLRK